jgi:hypothetical protein
VDGRQGIQRGASPHDDGRPAVGDDVRQAFGGEVRFERDVGAPGSQYRQDRHDHVEAPLGTEPDDDLGADTEAPQHVSETVGSLVQRSVAQRVLATGHGGHLGVPPGGNADQLVDRTIG